MDWMFVGFLVIAAVFGICAIRTISKYPSENVASKRLSRDPDDSDNIVCGEKCADYNSDFCQDACEYNPDIKLSRKVDLWVKIRTMLEKKK
jgi:hypothetical protein